MSKALLIGPGIVALALLAVFVGYYARRVKLARAAKDDTAFRFGSYMREVGAAAGTAQHPPESPPKSNTLGKAVGLRSVGNGPVYLSRDKQGKVVFQVEQKPSMPVKYVLEPAGRAALMGLSQRLTRELGATWSVLAEEDEAGLVRITRLG